jgi:hypothetical protein
MNRVQYLLLLALLVPATACVTARAATPPEDHPVLLVPPAPPRSIEPLPVEPPAIEPVADLPNSTPATPPRPRPQREPTKPGATDPKPETKPPDTPTDPAVAGQPATQPVPPLRAPGDPDGPEITRQISGALERAKKMLGSLNTQSLNGDRRANYDNANSFIKQAEDALKANNLMNAKSLADRAETIARALTGG